MNILSIVVLSAALALADAAPSPGTNLAPSATAALSERAYPVDPGSFFRLARHAIGEKEIQSDAVVLRQYLAQHGIHLSSPSSFSFKYEAKSLVVISTRENLERIEALLPPPPPPPQVMFARTYQLGASNVFAEMRPSINGARSQSGIGVLRNFLKDKGVELSPPASLFYSFGLNTLQLYATQKDLDRIEKLIAETPPAK